MKPRRGNHGKCEGDCCNLGWFAHGKGSSFGLWPGRDHSGNCEDRSAKQVSFAPKAISIAELFAGEVVIALVNDAVQLRTDG